MGLNVKGYTESIRAVRKSRDLEFEWTNRACRARRINEKGAKRRVENELWRNVAKNMYWFDWRARARTFSHEL